MAGATRAFHGVSIAPQGGNTGLVGGGVPDATSARGNVWRNTRSARLAVSLSR